MLTLLGGIVGNWLQSTTQQRQFDRQLAISVQQQQHNEVVSAFREMTASLDKPTLTALRIIRAARGGIAPDSVAKLIQIFHRDRSDWEASYNRVRLLAGVYFGTSAESSMVLFSDKLAWDDSILTTILRQRRALSTVTGHSSTADLARRAHADFLAGTESALETESALHYAMERYWASNIQLRRTGSFDPLSRWGKYLDSL